MAARRSRTGGAPAIGCLALLFIVLASPERRAWADPPAPPPDPRRGERPDGRVRGRISAAQVALAVPRILLTPPRLIVGLVGQAARGVFQLDFRHHVAAKVARMVTTQDGLIGVRPIVRWYSGFSPLFGLSFFDDRSMGPRSHIGASLTVGLPQLLLADVAVAPPLPPRYRFEVAGAYVRRDDQIFRGVGLASYGALRPNGLPSSRYGIDAVDVSARFRARLGRRTVLHLGEVWGYRAYRDGRSRGSPAISTVYCDPGIDNVVLREHGDDDHRCLHPGVDARLVPGFYDGADFLATDAQIVLDTRENDAAPWHGARVEVGARYAHGLGRDAPQWIHGRGAVTGTIALGATTRVLVLRVAAEILEPFGQAPVPFTELVVLGGDETLRGFPLARFRDHSSLMFTAEYRYQIWMWADAAIFADYGGVFGRHFDGFAIDRMVPDVGAGLRLHSKNRFAVRLQMAYGFGEGLQLFFATSTGL